PSPREDSTPKGGNLRDVVSSRRSNRSHTPPRSERRLTRRLASPRKRRTAARHFRFRLSPLGRVAGVLQRPLGNSSKVGLHMRYLVTGGAGFIGSHLVECLVAAGQDVVILDDLSSGRRENFAAVRRRVSFIRGSVTDLSTCRRAVEGADYVLHQAALTSVQRSVDEPLAAHEVNATGTLNVLLAARDARVRRVVYAGSTSAYGNPATLPNSEDHVTRPLSP